MTHRRHTLLLVALFAMTLTCSYSLSTDELARYLGVSSWSTVVDLPPESFVAEIWTIKDGIPEGQLIEGMPAWSRNPDKGLTVMLGKHEDKYRVVVAYGGGATLGALSNISTLSTTTAPSLPERVTEGDYVLFGMLKDKGLQAEDMASYKAGFLLRIKKKG